MTLPAAGRQGDAPGWPLAEKTDRESVLWDREWCRPQAVMWGRNGQEVEVAMYVRSLAMAEQLNATVAARTLVRQQQEALGLSLPGLARNRWRIDAGVSMPVVSGARRAPTKARFEVVPGGAA